MFVVVLCCVFMCCLLYLVRCVMRAVGCWTVRGILRVLFSLRAVS